MDDIDFNHAAIIHKDNLSDFSEMINSRHNSSETKTLSIEEFLDRINEESVYYKTFTIVDEGFQVEHRLIRQVFVDYPNNEKLDALIELYDEVYVDSIRYYTTEQLGKNMTVLLYD